MVHVRNIPSPNFERRPDGVPVTMVVLHYTNMATAQDALAKLIDPTPPRVSAHYMVDENGDIIQLVDTEYTAWHAGLSFWRGVNGVNPHSIGVELVNKGVDFGYTPFPDAQIDAVLTLLDQICIQNPIDIRNIVGHSDVAPDRKTDPGHLFPWQRLAEEGFGVWPTHANPTRTDDIRADLKAFGYNPQASLEGVVRAFNHHFCGRDSIETDDLFHARLNGLSTFF